MKYWKMNSMKSGRIKFLACAVLTANKTNVRSVSQENMEVEER
jgi:hypothetical protein